MIAVDAKPAAVRTSSRRAYELWSQVYDDDLNPLLSLERRILAKMLPCVRGLDVVDAGCGTGRWLRQLAKGFPKTLIGVDDSPAMLARAAAKAIPGADLRNGDCAALPVASASIDLALACFVLCHIGDLEAAAKALARAARPNANLFLTDMHPETASRRNWKRSFRANGAVVEIEAHSRSLDRIASAFAAAGFATLSVVEPAFGGAERRIFERSGKLREFDLSRGMPAIYILHLRKTGAAEQREPLGCGEPGRESRAPYAGSL